MGRAIFNRDKLRRRDHRIDELLKDGPRYVERARERARQQITEDLRQKQQARHKVA